MGLIAPYESTKTQADAFGSGFDEKERLFRSVRYLDQQLVLLILAVTEQIHGLQDGLILAENLALAGPLLEI